MCFDHIQPPTPHPFPYLSEFVSFLPKPFKTNLCCPNINILEYVGFHWVVYQGIYPRENCLSSQQITICSTTGCSGWTCIALGDKEIRQFLMGYRDGVFSNHPQEGFGRWGLVVLMSLGHVFEGDSETLTLSLLCFRAMK